MTTKKAYRADLGDVLSVEVNCGLDGVLTDPELVTLQVIDPDGNGFSYNTEEGSVSQSSTGVFYHNVTFNLSGTWRWRYEVFGDVQGADTGEVFVPETVWG
jgi:hypothetical protein